MWSPTCIKDWPTIILLHNTIQKPKRAQGLIVRTLTFTMDSHNEIIILPLEGKLT
jgi:hypothetical protein